ncbi:MAG: hypothetical protein DRJ42_02770 [Deltaproteobacteria bacterium]|nr:MAG: hypothetical protein DRJ42_02770 [Deltaproteobacteria bacterium]
MSSGPVISMVVAVFALVAFACGDDVDVVTDSGSTDTGTDGGGTGTPIDIPWLAAGAPPVGLTPCPDGWREVTGAYVTECDPYPEAGPEACGPGEAHFPGEPGCRAVGAACPSGDYATVLPSTGEIIYVKAGADPGGEGSRSSPYGSLSEVSWLTVTAGTTVALAKGTYAGTLPLQPGAQVIGACARDTIVTGVDAPVLAVVTVNRSGAPAVVRNLSIADAPQIGAVVRVGRELTLEGVIIERSRIAGLVAGGSGAVLTLDDVVVRGVRPEAGTGALGRTLSPGRSRSVGCGDYRASRFRAHDRLAFGVRFLDMPRRGAGVRRRCHLRDHASREVSHSERGDLRGLRGPPRHFRRSR